MDPIANLNEQRTIAAAFFAAADSSEIGIEFDAISEGVRLAELVQALDAWRASGGFDPYTESVDTYSEERAVEVLKEVGIDGAYLWHSGGNIWLGRVDFTNDPTVDAPYCLISDNEETTGNRGWFVGYYPDEEATGERYVIANNPSALVAAVQALALAASEAVA